MTGYTTQELTDMVDHGLRRIAEMRDAGMMSDDQARIEIGTLAPIIREIARRRQRGGA